MKLTKLIALAQIDQVQHPIYGLVQSWPTLEKRLKQLLVETGAVMHRRIETMPSEPGWLVKVHIVITTGDEQITTEGMALAVPDPKKPIYDPVRAAVTAASRQALSFALLAGGEPVQLSDDAEADAHEVVETEVVETEVVEPVGPPMSNPHPANNKPPAPATDKAKRLSEFSLRLNERLNGNHTALLAATRDARRKVGRHGFEGLHIDDVERAMTNLADDKFVKAYATYALLSPAKTKSLLDLTAGVPLLFADHNSAMLVAEKILDA